MRESSQRNQQSHKCLVSQEPCQRTTGTGWELERGPIWQAKWEVRVSQETRDARKGGQESAGRAMGVAVCDKGCWMSVPPQSLKGFRHCPGYM